MLHTGNIFGSLLITGAVLELRGELGNIGTGLGQHWVGVTNIVGQRGNFGETLGKLWEQLGIGYWVLGTGKHWQETSKHWQETVKGITKVNIVGQRGNFGETLGATTNIGEQWLGREQDLCFFSKSHSFSA